MAKKDGSLLGMIAARDDMGTVKADKAYLSGEITRDEWIKRTDARNPVVIESDYTEKYREKLRKDGIASAQRRFKVRGSKRDGLTKVPEYQRIVFLYEEYEFLKRSKEINNGTVGNTAMKDEFIRLYEQEIKKCGYTEADMQQFFAKYEDFTYSDGHRANIEEEIEEMVRDQDRDANWEKLPKSEPMSYEELKRKYHFS